jgi:hypothetical protein
MLILFSERIRNKYFSQPRNLCRSDTCQSNDQNYAVKTPYVYDGKGGDKSLRTYRNYIDEVGLTEECPQQDRISMFVENTLMNVTIHLLSTSSTTNNNQHSSSFRKTRS